VYDADECRQWCGAVQCRLWGSAQLVAWGEAPVARCILWLVQAWGGCGWVYWVHRRQLRVSVLRAVSGVGQCVGVCAVRAVGGGACAVCGIRS